MKKTDNTELFESMPVSRAVISLVVPTIISYMITVVYNMADTFFIGQLNNPDQVAAATLSMPPFVMLTGIANLFGVGGASFISRSLGEGRPDKAGRGAAFSIWTCAAAAFVYGFGLYFMRGVLLPLLGADSFTYGYCSDYLLWTTAIGGVPVVLSGCLANLVRAEGCARHASIGMAAGGVLNIALDPIMIFGLGLGVRGAAMATMLSNLFSLVYFVVLLRIRRGVTAIKFSPRAYTLHREVSGEILLVGLTSFMMTFMGTMSNLLLNKLIVSFSNQAMAGMGIAKKIDTLAFAISNGMTQGVLPLIGYNFAAKNFPRMRSAIKTAFAYSITLAAVGTAFLLLCAVPVVRFFIDDAETVAYGQHFLRILAVTCPAVSVTMMVISIFQATGQKGRPMFLSFTRKGGLDIPLMLIMNAAAGISGVPWAAPVSDVLAMSIALSLFIPYWHSVKRHERGLGTARKEPDTEEI